MSSLVEQSEWMVETAKVGQRIRKLRLRRSMGLVQLGECIELSPSYLSQLENGHVVPTLRNLARIAVAFGKTLSWFFEADVSATTTLADALDRMEVALADARELTKKVGTNCCANETRTMSGGCANCGSPSY